MRTYTLTVNGKTFSIAVKEFTPQHAALEINGTRYEVQVDDIETDNGGPMPVRRPAAGAPARTAPPSPTAGPPAAGGGAGRVTAPIPGLILEIFVREGAEVKSGQPVLKMEAMKMETVINAPAAGTVGTIRVNAGDTVNQGQELMIIG